MKKRARDAETESSIDTDRSDISVRSDISCRSDISARSDISSSRSESSARSSPKKNIFKNVSTICKYNTKHVIDFLIKLVYYIYFFFFSLFSDSLVLFFPLGHVHFIFV